MPIIKSAIKRVKQAKARTARNRHYREHMKAMIKLMIGYVQKNDSENAKKILPKVMKVIDTCAKKNILHKNNAARKKSRIQKMLNNIGTVTAEKPVKKLAKRTEKKGK